MKIKNGYVLKKFADKFIALAADDAADNNNVLVTLNGSGAYTWELLQDDLKYDEVVLKLLDKYYAPQNVIQKDLDEFLNILREANLLDE